MDTRPLPPGWVASFDAVHQATFYVLTTTNPPESSWTHPDDNPKYAATTPAFAPPAGPPPGAPPGQQAVHQGGPAERAFGDQHPSSVGAQAAPEEKKGGFGGMFRKLKSLVDETKGGTAHNVQHGGGGHDNRGAYQSSPYAQPPMSGPAPHLMGQQQQMYGNDPQAHYSQGYGQPPYGQHAPVYGQQTDGYRGQHDDRGMFGGGGGHQQGGFQQGGYQQGYGGHQQQQQKSSGIGMGGVALAGAGGLVGGLLIADAMNDDDENDAYREGYQDAMDDGDGSDGGGSD